MNSTYAAALVRGLVLTIGAFAGPLFADMLSGNTIQHALLVGAAAAVPVFMIRFGGEGAYDANRAEKNS